MPGHRKRRQFKQTDAFTRGMVIGLKRAGNVAIYRNAGATRVTSARVDRRILRQAVAAPQATCTAILQHVQDTLDHLDQNHFPRQRLEWCRARSTWMTEWHRVVFSDESRFCLSSDSRRVRVWRRRGERSNPAAIVERPTVRQRGIMVWGAIAYDSRSPLLRIQGTMTAQRYVDDVLRPVTLPYLQGVPNALYQQDNARTHTARISQQALQDVQMLPWPPYSPDLSPIEHVWDIIGRRLHALPQPRSEDELWQMVEREWRAIPQDAIRTLIDSLPRRVVACIAFALLETVTTAILDKFPELRDRKIWVVLGLCLLGYFGGLIFTTNSGVFWLQIFDKYAASFSVLIIAFLECFLISWVYGSGRFLRDIEKMIGAQSYGWFMFWSIMWKFLTPLTLLFILGFNWVDHTPAKIKDYVFPTWANAVGWVVTMMPTAVVVGILVGRLLALRNGSVLERCRALLQPVDGWGPAHNIVNFKAEDGEDTDDTMRKSSFDNPTFNVTYTFETAI
ncbi:hypothetical protein LAZ67_15003058 [Cordylochernes scorpioides]|uniref:Tc1-like transposase DDE domain-containing protein n=1 Tax=Cordylochernes scorpioides TaxID=51811 RepID=A0ABY6LA04_9ARAC|nr:hypothetical protein LAZ67_15003058 [Cordylochernes scorpioides]